jgi:hypothetical protein
VIVRTISRNPLFIERIDLVRLVLAAIAGVV